MVRGSADSVVWTRSTARSPSSRESRAWQASRPARARSPRAARTATARSRRACSSCTAPRVPCLAGQPTGAGQVAAGGEDRNGAFPQGVLVLHRHDPPHRIRPQVVRAVPAVVQHPDEGNLPGEVIESDGPARYLGDLAGGASAERGQRGQRLTLRIAYPAEHLLAGILPRRGGPGREGQPDHGGPAMKRFCDPRVLSEPTGQRPHFDVGEGEVLAADPDHLAGGLTPREGNIRCLAPGQNEVGRRRQRSRDLAEKRRPRRARRDLVYVIKQQAHSSGARRIRASTTSAVPGQPAGRTRGHLRRRTWRREALWRKGRDLRMPGGPQLTHTSIPRGATWWARTA